MSPTGGNDSMYLFDELDPKSSILPAKNVAEMVSNGALIDQETYDERCLQSTSYDVRIGKRAIVGGQGNTIDLTKQPLVLHPGCYAGVVSHERFRLPDRILAQIGGKRKLSYDGLILLTGSIVDPGYEGHLLFGLYNASTKKVVLPETTKICTLTFVLLGEAQKPVSSDPNLKIGELPNDFVNNMANMDVLPWSEISHEVKHIQRITKDILDLRQRYENVLEPIKQLTASVAAVTRDVGSLSDNIRQVGDKVEKLDDATLENARQLGQAIESVRMLTAQVGDVKSATQQNGTEIQTVKGKVELFKVILYAIGSVALLVLGGWINSKFFTPPCAPVLPLQQLSVPGNSTSHPLAPTPPTPVKPTPSVPVSANSVPPLSPAVTP